ncbi:Uncharacterised protein [Fusobacterium varium]|nr:Uncharacterised protein [Fusobacterium varium]
MLRTNLEFRAFVYFYYFYYFFTFTLKEIYIQLSLMLGLVSIVLTTFVFLLMSVVINRKTLLVIIE